VVTLMALISISSGVLQVAPERLQVITPTTTTVKRLIMRMKPFHSTKLANEPEVVYQSKSNKKNQITNR
jgi:hypothetical protein